jgi:hypothetical protein
MVALSLVTGCSAAPDNSSQTITMTTPRLVSSATTNGATPMFTVARNGSRVLSWVAPDSSGQSVLQVRVEQPGGVVVTSVLTDPLGSIEPHGEAPPQVTTSELGDIYAVYTVGKDAGGRFPVSSLRFARSGDGGSSWSDPVTVNEGEQFGSHNFHSLLAGPDSVIYTAWLHNVAGTSGVWLRISQDAGRTWSPAAAIHSEPTCPCCRTALARAPDGTLYASWRKIFAGDVRDIVVMASRDGGNTWEAPVKPRDDGWVFPGCPHAGASLKVDAAGTVHIGWWTGRQGAAGVWYGRSTDGGRTWTATPIDTASRSAPAHVQLALSEQGAVVVAWDDGQSSRPRIFLRASFDKGQVFGPQLAFSDSAVAGQYPVLDIHHDSITVAWSQVADAAYRAELAARPDMKDPNARMSLPRVGQQEVWQRTAALRDLLP